MNHAIVEQLQSYSRQIIEHNLERIDCQQLSSHLTDTANLVESLLEKAALADSLFQLFRDDLLTRTRAVARLTGNNSSLVERLITSDQVSLAELLVLRTDIQAAFDAAFSSKLKDATLTQPDDRDKLAQYKIG